MPLDASEVLALAPKVAAFLRELIHDLRPTSEGGRRLTRAERRRLVKRAAELAVQLGVDLVD